MRKKIFLVFFLILVLGFSGAEGRRRWLSPRGSDTNAGTDSSVTGAWEHMGHAIPLLVADDTLFVRGGNYISAADSISHIHSRNAGIFAASGSSGSPIVVKAFGDSIAYFQGVGSNTYSARTFLNFNSMNFIIVDGRPFLSPLDSLYLVFEARTTWVYGGDGEGGWGGTVRPSADSLFGGVARPDIKNCIDMSNSDDCKIIGIEIDGDFPPYAQVWNVDEGLTNTLYSPEPLMHGGNMRYGIYCQTTSGSYRDTIMSCYIHDIYYPCGNRGEGNCGCPSVIPTPSDECFVGPPGTTSYRQPTGEAIQLTHKIRQHYIARNTIVDVSHAAISVQVTGFADNANGYFPRFNKIVNNKITNHWGGGIYLSYGCRENLVEGNIITRAGESTYKTKDTFSIYSLRNTIRNNVIYSPNQWGYAGIIIAGETATPSGDSNYVYNNTVFGAHFTGLRIHVSAGRSVKNNVVKNNIFYKSWDPTREWGYTAGLGYSYGEISCYLYDSDAAYNWLVSPYTNTNPITTHFGGNKFHNNLLLRNSLYSDGKPVIFYGDASYGGGTRFEWSVSELHTFDPIAFSGNIEDDPLLTSEDPDTYGLHLGWWRLKPLSPCIDAGTYINDPIGDFVSDQVPGYGWDSLSMVGSQHDIGAHEYNVDDPVDSLYISKPDGHEYDWGDFDLNTTPISKTVRLLNHTTDTLNGTARLTKNWYTINTTSSSLGYSIPPGEALQFTVEFAPRDRGINIMAWVIFDHPFPPIFLIGTAVGTNPSRVKPMKIAAMMGGNDQGITPSPSQPIQNGVNVIVSYYCEDVVKSSIETQAITDTSAVLHFHTGDASVTGFRYHSTGNNPWIYRRDLEDSTQHTITIDGLTAPDTIVWESNTKYGTCDSMAYSDSTQFVVESSCPTVVKSSIGTKGISTSNAKLQLTTDMDAHVGFRYHTGSGAWIYRHDADADSTVHTISIVSLTRGEPYTWESNTTFAGCDSSAYGDSTYFLSACPVLARANHAAKLKTTISASLVFDTDYATHGGFRYHATGSNPWVYRHDADADSTGHKVDIASLNPGSQYVFESNAKKAYCDSTSYADSLKFSTLCPTITASNLGTKTITQTTAKFFLNTDYTAHVHYRYSKVTPESWIYRTDTDADSIGHTISIAGLTSMVQYKWQVNTKYNALCDSTAYGNQQTFTTIGEE